MQKELKNKFIKGLIWNLAEKYLSQFFSLIIGIVLARLLMPETYGTMVIVINIVNILKALIEGEIASALIKKKDITEKDLSTMFFMLLFLSCGFYIFVFALAPWLSNIYKIFELTMIIRIFAIILPIGAFRTFLVALLQRTLDFKKIFFSTLAGTLFGGIIGIIIALNSGGVWALVFYYLCNTIIDTIMLILQLQWKPRILFSFTVLKEFYSFSLFAFGKKLMNQYTNQFIEMFLGLKYSVAQLSYYNRGKQYPYLLCNDVNGVLSTLMFPILCQINENEQEFQNAIRRFLKISTFFQLPILFGFSMIAEPFVKIVLTNKWLPCVPFLQITCITYSFWPYLTCYEKAMQSKGYVQTTFRNEGIIALLRIIICFIALQISPLAVAWAYLFLWFLDTIVNAISSRRTIKYTIIQQITDVFPNYFCTFIMIICVYLVGKIISSDFIKICVQILIGGVIYILIAAISNNDSYKYILELLKKRIHC